MAETLIKVENVSKKFCRDLKRGLLYGVKDLGSELIGLERNTEVLRPKEFWAVRDVSFELKRGECLGLIGHNGAGKSTLLKMLNGLFKPDSGRIEMHGRVSALIELGAGFNPILTGRENIYVNGAILGFSKEDVDERFDKIASFADIGDFLDTPVQYYSSGMKVRLGFAVAAQMEPDVLILDEVLAVGDSGFKIKSFNKISELIRNAAVIFVSHSMPQLSRISSKLLYLKNGVTKHYGDVADGINAYLENFEGETARVEYNGGAEIIKMDVYGSGAHANEKDVPIINYSEDLYLDLDILIKKEILHFDIIIQITDRDMNVVGQLLTSKVCDFVVVNSRKKVSIKLLNLLFIDGEYSITVFINEYAKGKSNYEILAVYRHYSKFKMRGLGHVLYAPIHLQATISEA